MKYRTVVRQRDLNSRSRVGDYYLSDQETVLDPVMVQSIIDKYTALKFEHLMKGDIVRESGTGEVRMILRRFNGSAATDYYTKYDIFVASTGWRIDTEVLDEISNRFEKDSEYWRRFVK